MDPTRPWAYFITVQYPPTDPTNPILSYRHCQLGRVTGRVFVNSILTFDVCVITHSMSALQLRSLYPRLAKCTLPKVPFPIRVQGNRLAVAKISGVLVTRFKHNPFYKPNKTIHKLITGAQPNQDFTTRKQNLKLGSGAQAFLMRLTSMSAVSSKGKLFKKNHILCNHRIDW